MYAPRTGELANSPVYPQVGLNTLTYKVRLLHRFPAETGAHNTEFRSQKNDTRLAELEVFDHRSSTKGVIVKINRGQRLLVAR